MCNCILTIQARQFRVGLIWGRRGGGVGGVHRAKYWPWSTGVQKNQIQKYFFEVKLKLIIAGNGISRDLIFKILITGPPRELVPSALKSLGSQFI